MLKRTVIVLSGGMDSSVLLAYLKSKKHEVFALTFDYGSKHNRMEQQGAKAIAKHYGVKVHHIVKLPFINELFLSALLKKGEAIPEGHYQAPTMKSTVVPFRNTIMLSIAAGFAESIGATSIAIANHAGDHAIYPDCRLIFIGAMREVLRFGGYKHIKLDSPFVGTSKMGIAILGKKLKVPFELTYSCYKGGKNHCGKCGTCVERKEAFQLAGIKDPTRYS